MSSAEDRGFLIHFGVFELDLESRELRKHGSKIKLRDQSFQVLALLLERPGRLVTREELQRKLWGADTFVDFDHGLNKVINRLREALDDSAEAPRFVETLPKRGYRFIASIENGRPGRVMLAVLPFENLTGEPEQEYLSDGMTEEMITRLGQLQPEQLGVIARTSVMGYKRSHDLHQIARDLGVQYVVEGSVRRSGNQVRVAAQMIQVKDQTQLWAETYDRNTEDILRLQSDVAGSVADAIKLNLTPQKRSNLASVRIVSPQAYDAYLRGRYMLDRRTAEGFQKAVLNFQQSIDADPSYAPAYAALGDCYGLMVAYGISPEDSVQKAQSMARKALAIDSSIAEAHATLALIAQNHDWNFAEAEREYRLAFASDPNYAIAHLWHSIILEVKGRVEESLLELEIAHALDPRSLLIRAAEGEYLYAARRYDEAIQSLNRTVEMEPNLAGAYFWRALAYGQKGMFSEAISDLQRALRIDDNALYLAALGHTYALSNRRQEARKILLALNDRAKHEYVDSWCQAVIYAGLGDRDQAFRRLEEAYQQRSYWLLSLKIAPLFDSLRADQRFTAMVHRLGLDQ
jgi:TolB-like protein/Tfp pilus assembly protein PilF